MISVRFTDILEHAQQQQVGEEQQSSSTKQFAAQDVVDIMAVVRDSEQSTSLVHSPKARRSGYARQRIKLVISRSRNELDQVHHIKAMSDVHVLDEVHHNRMSSILATE
jgi:hypothetical protein